MPSWSPSHARDVRWVVAAERDGADAGYGADSLAALFAEPAPAYPALHSDTAAIMFTTGTTGKPKGVVWKPFEYSMGLLL